jgi:hypothetical protein
LVCADVALSGTHCELRKRPFWKLLARAHAVIERNGRISSTTSGPGKAGLTGVDTEAVHWITMVLDSGRAEGVADSAGCVGARKAQ